ncbi:MAG: C1 family peptidase [Acidobacteriota bacterium]
MKTLCRSLVLLAALAAIPAMAQYKPVAGEAPSKAGALTPAMLKALQQSAAMTPSMRADRNALAGHSIRSLTVNQALENRTDDLFTHVIKHPGSITNQKESGRCWLFAGLNTLRPEVMNKYNMKDFTLSQAYEQFYQKLEDANRSLELAIALRNEPLHSRRMDTFLKNLISDGGNWNYVQALIEKYGAVPQSVMPNDKAASSTREMNTLMSARLRKAVLEMRTAAAKGAPVSKLRDMKMGALKDIYKILVLCLGQPPQTFKWRYETKDGKVTPLETYTPKSFYKKFIGSDLNNYIRLVNYPGKPMHSHLEWAWERNMADHQNLDAVNITMKEMRDMVLKSVMANQPVWFGANASAEGDYKKGLWLEGIMDTRDLFGIDFSMDKKDTLAYDNGTPNHAMVFTGVDVQNGEPDKWKVENSWGSKPGRKGWFTIGSRWFNKHVYEVIINKRFVPDPILNAAKKKPIVLPPWDPFTDWASGQ